MYPVEGAGYAAGAAEVGNRMPNKQLGKDDFLKLMITQLKYQDPLQPTSDKEFIAQMAQFSSLEQMKNLNDGIQAMKAFQEKVFHESLVGQAINLIGKSVQALVPEVDLQGQATGNTVTISGLVTGMRMVEGVPKVIVNGQTVDLGSLAEVRESLMADGEGQGEEGSDNQ